MADLHERGLLVDPKSFGPRLHAAARAAATATHDLGPQHPHRTLIHGDLKAANVFLREQQSGEATEATFDAGLIDFQWCGWGLGATDLAYLLASSADPQLLTFDGRGEAALLDTYHALLCDALRAGGVAEERWLSRAQLTTQYETALLDLCRLVVAYAWPRLNISPAVLAANAQVSSLSLSLCNH